MQAILTSPWPILLAAIVLFCLLGVLAALAFLHLMTRVARRFPDQAPLPAFVGVVATAWALSMGFAASDIWALNAKAEQAASKEFSAVTRLLGAFNTDALNAPEAFEAVVDYANAVASTELASMASRAGDPSVVQAIQHIRIAIINLVRTSGSDPVIAKTVQDFDDLQDARIDRLVMGQIAVDESKWYLLLSLTLLTMAALAIVHVGHPRAGRNALLIFALTAGVSMWILSINTDPYADSEYVEVETTEPE